MTEWRTLQRAEKLLPLAQAAVDTAESSQLAEDWREAVRQTEILSSPSLCPGALPITMMYLKSLIATRAWDKVSFFLCARISLAV